MQLALARALTAGAILWAALVLWAPYGLHSDTFGSFAAYLYAGSSHICHQRTERSFALAGVQLPVCARCFGLYLSGAAGALAAWLAAASAMPHARLLLALTAVPTAITWALEAAGLVPFSNSARAIAALPLGAAAGWVFVQMLRYDSESDGRQIHDSRTAARLG